ncbi:hypothetical protein QBC33DRAFT_579352 [Phialemonium atrogriseum]|uniref:FAD/NAD(P)-binding domain-containing protein n=1 Tax=Phialemonium atrogriseum TaxID=1093897 RepID=A0AAJ0FLZ2_9PEZI|nr:uncharacterized protein QBC33DRAFT_579352 [Phialemonium atrogriseum]KAK1765600.1 hypothetical protein QBC33DRAFT_579352 [Phialemonium atrogriseum]
MSVLEKLPCSLPNTPVPEDIDVSGVAKGFERILQDLNSSNLTTNAIWRDVFALTGSTRTFYLADTVSEKWTSLTRLLECGAFEYKQGSAKTMRMGDESAWVEARYTFEVIAKPARTCTAMLSLVLEAGEWKIWVIRTILDQLRGHPNVDRLNPDPTSIAAGQSAAGSTSEANNFECAIIGAGQAGLSVAGRLKALGVSYVVLEKNQAVGDNWRLRYESTKPHLPFDRTFPDHYPVFLTKYDLAKGYSDWAGKFGINVWLGTTLQSGQWHADQKVWDLRLLRNGKETAVKATHVVMAVGAGGQIPVMPTYPGADKFRGVILHSGEYDSAGAWKGKNGIVVGTANTAHDVADDMLEAGLSSVTMVQRSPTYVLPCEYFLKITEDTYNTTSDTDNSDMMSLTGPLAVARLMSNIALNGMARAEPDRFDALEKAGFRVIRYGDIIYQLFERFGGHYMDVGASAKIAKGLIKIKSDALPTSYTEDGLLFDDGTELKADAIVHATGFVGNLRDVVRDIFGDEVSARVEDFWGLDSEGEIKGAFKASGQPQLWFHGGPCGHARYFSRFVALQIRAELDGVPLLGRN